jgi:hypothetical protein
MPVQVKHDANHAEQGQDIDHQCRAERVDEILTASMSLVTCNDHRSRLVIFARKAVEEVVS